MVARGVPVATDAPSSSLAVSWSSSKSLPCRWISSSSLLRSGASRHTPPQACTSVAQPSVATTHEAHSHTPWSMDLMVERRAAAVADTLMLVN